jgi:PAS domain S-box-containing protein
METSKHIQNELAIQGTRMAIWDWDVIEGVVRINQRWAEIVGYKLEELEPVMFETWGSLVHPDDLKITSQLLQDHFDGKINYYDTQFRMRHKKGHWVWVHSRGKVFERNKQGEPIRMSGTHIDITPEKELEISLKKAIRERDTLLMEVHHRVKNNLQLLLSLTRLKSKDGLIETSEVVNSIESIARAYEALYKTKSIDQIPVGDHLKELIESITFATPFKLRIEADNIKKDISFLIPLGLIVTELVSNSRKHSGFKSDLEKLEVSLTIKKSIGKIELLYADNGKGYHKNRYREEQGSFGLSIVQSLIEQLGGKVLFYNQNGACAKMEFPT